MAKLAGVSRVRIDKGIAELTGEKVVKEDSPSQKIRKAGGGSKLHKQSQLGLIEALE